jgi:rubrerythrin
MPNTLENLKTAFAGESQAFQKYVNFARKAEQEGFRNVAKLFRTAAEAEKVHAEGHLRSMEGVGTTLQNLHSAVEGETYEFTTMYPPMLSQAVAENHRGRRMLDYAVRAEAVHAKLYAAALEAVRQGKDLESVDFYYCPACGYIEIGTPTDPCPICGIKADRFVKM